MTHNNYLIAMAKATTSRKMNYAGFWIRLFSALIDMIFAIALGAVSLGAGGMAGGIVATLINVYLVGTYGFSIGKKLTGLRVVKENGKMPIGLVDALIRETVGKFVSGILIGVGFLVIGFDEKKQGFHDRIAGTYVVYEK